MVDVWHFSKNGRRRQRRRRVPRNRSASTSRLHLDLELDASCHQSFLGPRIPRQRHRRKAHAYRICRQPRRCKGPQHWLDFRSWLAASVRRARRNCTVAQLKAENMATATLTQNTDTVLAEIFIAAPPARVFEAITDL